MSSSTAPTVLVAILAKQKAPVLPLYLRCLEELDYPKERIALHVRTNNNLDDTEGILRRWLDRVGKHYAHAELEAGDVADHVERFGVHEWNAERFSVLGAIRQRSMDRALELGCDFYFVADCDNFLRARTLGRLVGFADASASPAVVAPLLRHVDYPANPYANYHSRIDANGYFEDAPSYWRILRGEVTGLFFVPVVHCTYLVRADAIDRLRYNDGSGRHEYVIFSDSARRQHIPQILDAREDYGCLTLDERTERAEELLADGFKRSERV